MEKVYSLDPMIAKGKKLEDALVSLKISSTFIDATKSLYSNVYYFKLLDPLAIMRIEKVIPALEVLFSTQSGEISFAHTPHHPIAHFSLIIENEARTIAHLSNYKHHLSKKENTVLYGIDIATGELVYSNLIDTPHLLIAGASGSGKSVLLHNIIASLCKYNKKNDTSLVLIDTKQVEFAQYGIEEFDEYLAAPICYDAKTALYTLKAISKKMDERFAKMKEKGLKIYDGTKWVVIIDEFADLMLTNKHLIEPLIVRIAQMGRACGVHLVIATQRPSVDVCTGLIKANIPDRIALRCASIKDSMVILDKKGAETLKGKGEALVRIGNTLKKVQCFN